MAPPFNQDPSPSQPHPAQESVLPRGGNGKSTGGREPTPSGTTKRMAHPQVTGDALHSSSSHQTLLLPSSPPMHTM